MAYRRPVQLPQDLIGIIAAEVASSNGDRRTQTLALTGCMLVCRGPQWCRQLCTHAQALEDHPEYRNLVKTVTIVLKSKMDPGRSVVNDYRFHSWLKGLTSVTSLSLGTYGTPLEFSRLRPRPRDAIIQLCSLPSIRCLMFDTLYDLPPWLFCDAPKLKYLSLGSIIMDGSFQKHHLTEDDLKLITSTSPRIRLHFPRYNVNGDVERTIQALVPILPRIWKLSGRYDTMDEVALFSMSMIGGRKTLQELDLALLEDNYHNDNAELDIPPVIILPAKNLERLTLTFNHSARPVALESFFPPTTFIPLPIATRQPSRRFSRWRR
ncbi:hypothetical protein BKA70DRAFT_1230869 [Coprinopsis sp. MPI-PUGE-AT-0042]|nr:hypothetical protein BKA70DRAFT_1230869 [Coprinopsis sp. MPI-PUGE-AT-0042]